VWIEGLSLVTSLRLCGEGFKALVQKNRLINESALHGAALLLYLPVSGRYT
jgi:hypothetical protein